MVTKFIFDLQLFDDTFLDILEQQDGSYLIKTAEDLQGLATYVNTGNDCAGLTFKLAPENDVLDLSSITNFTPIGTYSNSFKGTFDGGNKTISNLKITGTNNNVGLFGYVEGGTVQNVKLINVSVSGNENVGGIVGTNSGGTIANCTIIGSVSGTLNIGGVIGNGSAGENCYYYKNNDTTYTNTTDGTQIYKLTLPTGVTNITGDVYHETDDNGNITVAYAPKDTNVTLTYSNDYLKVGDNVIKVQDNNYTFKMTAADTEIETATFLDTLDKEGTTYLIKTAEDLQGLAAYVNNGGDTSGKTFKLAPENDVLDLSSISNWIPIGNDNNHRFKGTFDGDNQTISNLKITGTNNNAGLFGYLDNGGKILNLNLTNINISGEGWVGGIVGYNYGIVELCKVSGVINGTTNVSGIAGSNYSNDSIRGCNNSARVNGNSNVGGIVGIIGGGMIDSCNNSGTVSGNSDVGGVVGNNSSGTIGNCYYYKKDTTNYTDTNGTPVYDLTLPDDDSVTVKSGAVTIGDKIYYYSDDKKS